jgi:hypothetical protein
VRPLRPTVIAVIASAAVVVAVILVLHGHAGRSASAPERPHRSTSPVRATPQQAAISRTQDAFLTRYLAYLDGAGTVRELPFSSITAREQVVRGGRIPPAFRDGSLRVSRVSGANTGYSAQATITASNRSESYVVTVQLLLTPRGWRVAQVATPDLAMDDNTRPVLGPSVPATAQRASGRFAVAYAAYRDTTSAAAPAPMTGTAQAELQDGQDPLAGTTRSTRQPRLRALRFGPLQGTEFSVTATVNAGGQQQRFTVLMVNHAGRWECDAFL